LVIATPSSTYNVNYCVICDYLDKSLTWAMMPKLQQTGKNICRIGFQICLCDVCISSSQPPEWKFEKREAETVSKKSIWLHVRAHAHCTSYMLI
jgi:hypothetical protein